MRGTAGLFRHNGNDSDILTGGSSLQLGRLVTATFIPSRILGNHTIFSDPVNSHEALNAGSATI